MQNYFYAWRDNGILERINCAGLSCEHRHVMPGIVDRLAATETAAMLADDCAFLADRNAIGIGPDLDRRSHGARGDRVFVVVEAHQAGLRDRRLRRVEPVEWPSNLHQLRPLASKACQIVRSARFGMLVRFGVGDASAEQPGVQLLPRVRASRGPRTGSARHPLPRREETLAHQSNLVLDLRFRGGRLCPFSQPEAGVQAAGSIR